MTEMELRRLFGLKFELDSLPAINGQTDKVTEAPMGVLNPSACCPQD